MGQACESSFGTYTLVKSRTPSRIGMRCSYFVKCSANRTALVDGAESAAPTCGAELNRRMAKKRTVNPTGNLDRSKLFEPPTKSVTAFIQSGHCRRAKGRCKLELEDSHEIKLTNAAHSSPDELTE